MPVKLTTLQQMQKEAVVVVELSDGRQESINFSYRPYTPAMVAEIIALTQVRPGVNTDVEFLARTVIVWDVMNDEGQPLSPDHATIERLPNQIIAAMWRAITEAAQPPVSHATA